MRVRVAGHLIVGARPERFLAASIASLDGVADVLLVNENSALAESENRRVLEASAFAARGALFVDPAPFTDFASARNRVLALHRRHAQGAWAAFIDADEVHRPLARRIAGRLDALDGLVATVDGYVRHFVRSFRWYTSVERRISFFRVPDALRWEGALHEHLVGLHGRSVALPYVYDHYGWLLSVREQAAKGRHYVSLGGEGETASDEEAAGADEAQAYAQMFARAIRYRGRPNPYVSHLEAGFERELAATDAYVAAAQPFPIRVRNAFRAFNYGYRWRGRALSPTALALVRP